jgi:hypothetical protein
MGITEDVKSLLMADRADPSGPARLGAGSTSQLAASLARLPAGKRGWISIAEARSLFSTKDEQYAFGEMDDKGKASLAAFADRSEHRATFDFMPVEGRLYFTRA